MKHLAYVFTTLCLIVLTACNDANNTGSHTTETDTSATTSGNTPHTAFHPKILLNLADSCNTPDGLAISADSSTILLAMPNFNNTTYQPRIYTILLNSLQPFTDLPVHPDTKHVCPMDLAFGPDGNVYINDNQFELYDKNYKSRLLKVTMKNGKPAGVSTVVNGFRLANGMVWKGNDLYITDSQWDTPADTAKSAIFHFTLSQLSGKTIQLTPGMNNPYILDTFTTIVGSGKVDNGVDGIDYDSKGNLYTGLFGDGRIFKITLNSDGSAAKKELFVPQGPIASVDGFIIDRKTDKLYVCDAKRNAIRTVSAEGTVSTLWENGDTDGSDGLLDQPAEILMAGNKLYISNFDKPSSPEFTNSAYNKPNTVSVITLP